MENPLQSFQTEFPQMKLLAASSTSARKYARRRPGNHLTGSRSRHRATTRRVRTTVIRIVHTALGGRSGCIGLDKPLSACGADGLDVAEFAMCCENTFGLPEGIIESDPCYQPAHLTTRQLAAIIAAHLTGPVLPFGPGQ